MTYADTIKAIVKETPNTAGFARECYKQTAFCLYYDNLLHLPFEQAIEKVYTILAEDAKEHPKYVEVYRSLRNVIERSIVR